MPLRFHRFEIAQYALMETSIITSKPAIRYQFKTGQRGLAEDVIVLPCRSVRLQGLGLSPRSGVCYCGFTLPGSRLAE
jgi:hypothetical protein